MFGGCMLEYVVCVLAVLIVTSVVIMLILKKHKILEPGMIIAISASSLLLSLSFPYFAGVFGAISEDGKAQGFFPMALSLVFTLVAYAILSFLLSIVISSFDSNNKIRALVEKAAGVGFHENLTEQPELPDENVKAVSEDNILQHDSPDRQEKSVDRERIIDKMGIENSADAPKPAQNVKRISKSELRDSIILVDDIEHDSDEIEWVSVEDDEKVIEQVIEKDNEPVEEQDIEQVTGLGVDQVVEQDMEQVAGQVTEQGTEHGQDTEMFAEQAEEQGQDTEQVAELATEQDQDTEQVIVHYQDVQQPEKQDGEQVTGPETKQGPEGINKEPELNSQPEEVAGEAALERLINSAFEHKNNERYIEAIQDYMEILAMEPDQDLTMNVVLDICVLYKYLERADLACDILQSYLDRYGNEMDNALKKQYEINLSELRKTLNN